jgi:hypothetical protein
MRIKVLGDVTVEERPGTTKSWGSGSNDTEAEGSGNMPRLDAGAVRATMRAALRRLDSWTLETQNAPAGGRRPQK